MALDLEEQEQLDEFKTWWKKNGKLTTALILIALLAYAAWQGFQYFQNKKSAEASEIYQTMLQLPSGKNVEIKSAADQLMQQYSSTPYAGRAAIYLAKTEFLAKDNKNAKSHLEWAIKNAKENPAKAVAGLQLAAIQAEEKDYEAALNTLKNDSDDGYSGLNHDLQGDIYLAQGKTDEAKKAYQNALLKLDANGKIRQFTQQKLESLGS